MKFNKILTVSIFCSLCFVLACNKTKEKVGAEKTKVESMVLPQSKGQPGEMVLVMDSLQWNQENGLGATLYSEVIGGIYPMLPQAEPWYVVNPVRPRGFQSILRQARNVIMVLTFDSKTRDTAIMKSLLTPEVVNELKTNQDDFIYIAQNVYARNQLMMILFAKDEATLKKQITSDRGKNLIRAYFEKHENETAKEKLVKTHDKKISKTLRSRGFNMKLYKGYKQAKKTNDFIWFRHPEVKFDKNIYIAKKPYTSEKQFELENIVKWRNEIAKQHIYGDPKNMESFVVTESLVPPIGKVVDKFNRHTVEVRGLWKTNNISMGGPFLSYVTTDKSGKYLYFIEGFVFAPGMDKREFIREMEVVLSTFAD